MRDPCAALRTSSLTLAVSVGISVAALGRMQSIGWLFGYLEREPFVLLFVVVAAGYSLGSLKFRGVGLGATASTLLVGLAISLWASLHGTSFDIPSFASTLFFNLFMFAVGLKVGPQFLSGLKRDARKFIVLALLVPILSLGLTLLIGRLFHFPDGMLAGIFAGANTATPGLGAAEAALTAKSTAATAAVSNETMGNMSTAFAFTYSLSMVLFIVMMKVLPRIFRRNVVADAHRLEEELKAGQAALPGSAEAFLHGALPIDLRVYRLENPRGVGQTLGELRKRHPFVAVERVRREGTIIDDPPDDFAFQLGDEVALNGRIWRLFDAATMVGPEVDVLELRDTQTEEAEVVATERSVIGQSLGNLASGAGYGLYLEAMFRGGEQVPFGPDTIVQKGDVLRVVGSKRHIEKLQQHAGRVVVPSLTTDIASLAIGLAVGAIIGSFSIVVFGIKFGLGSAVALLLVGIAIGTIRTRNPALGGPFPEPARLLVEDLGLNVFIAILGINAGAGVLKAIETGAILPALLAALAIGFIPAILAWVEGQYQLKMNSALLMGAVCGARCNSAGMRVSQEASKSDIPAIAYPVTFAISNIVLTLMCYLLAFLS